MSFVTADWAMAVFLLLALILVRGFRTQIKTDNAESYDNVAGGLVILALTALARVYFMLGLFDGVPFLSEPVFFDLAYWICIITGATFVISGVANWLPLARYHRKFNQGKIRNLDLLRKIEQLIGAGARLDSVLAHSLEYMTGRMSFTSGAVFKCSPSTGQLSVTATTGQLPFPADLLQQIRLKGIEGSQPLSRPDDGLGRSRILFPQGQTGPQVTLPILVSNRPVGYFLFWDDRSEEIDSDDMLTLRLAIDAIARKIDMDRMTLRQQSEAGRFRFRQRLQRAVIRERGTKEKFAVLARGLVERGEFDYVSLSILESTTNRIRRFSCGPEARILVEPGLPLPDSNSLTAAAYYADREVCHQSLTSDKQPGPDEIVTARRVSSLMALPLPVGGEYRVVLTLASEVPSAFGREVRDDLRSLNGLVAEVAWPETARLMVGRETRRLKELSRFCSVVSDGESQRSAIEMAARMISDELDAGLVRISRLDETGSFLESLALVSETPMTEMVPANGQMIISLMPLHEQVLKTGNQLMIDRKVEASRMPEIEARQAFTDTARTALLVPILAGSKAVGVISIADFDRRLVPALERGSRLFIQTVARLLSLAVGRPEVAAGPPAEYRPGEVPASGREIRTQVKSSLTGILGSVEMLRSNPASPADENLERYLSIIDRSARRIDVAVR